MAGFLKPVSELPFMVIGLSFSPGPPMQGNTNNYSGGVTVSAVPSMAKNDPTSTSSNVCKVNLSCFCRTFVHFMKEIYYACMYITGNNRPRGKYQNQLVWRW